MAKTVVIAACIFLFACEVLPAQRNQNPSTMYGTLSSVDNDFAISRPIGPLGCDNRTSYQSMSPDTWGRPKSLNSDAKSVIDQDFGKTNATQGEGSADSEKPTQNTEPFQPASFSRNPDLLPNGPNIPPDIRSQPGSSNRYPLFENQGGEISNDSIIQTPVDDSTPSSVLGQPMNYPVEGAILMPEYRPDLGHRSQAVTLRSWHPDNGDEQFDFENKKRESPGLREIFATGRYFGSLTMLYLRPAFEGNTALSTSVTGISTPFDFDYEAAPQFQFGFESKHGPGFEFNNWQYDETSNATTFTSDGVDVGTTSVWVPGPAQWSQLSAANSGETLTAFHTIDAESFGLNFFKEIKFPVSRLNGKFGLQYVAITHVLDARLTDSGNVEIGSLLGRSDMHAWGPQFAFEYFRPIGHTKFEFMTRFGGSALFGHQDQLVENSVSGDLSRVGADEFMTMFDFLLGGQYRKSFAEKRSVRVRAGLMFQSWLGGGTAILPQEDFGLRGFSISVGYNR